MCDTMVALGNSTKDGSVIFAKNSDRQPNEPHIIIKVPRKQYNAGEKLRCTYIEIDQARESYEVLLLKPSWIWGAEMGTNEFGLTIGNEAVFTKEKYNKTGLLGMDLLRLALERCKTSEEAVDLITELISEYGQGGNCGYEKPFTYHNSFLIADLENAWVLETAGEYWAAEKVKDVRSISNALTIGSRFDKSHPYLIEHAIEKGWCKSKGDFHFARCYSEKLFTHFSRSKERKACSIDILESKKGAITVDTLKEILRSHTPQFAGKEFTQPSLKSVCMHGGGLIGDHTTGSHIVSLHPNLQTHWVTGSSTPCISIFKPFWLFDEERFPFGEDEEEKAKDYWLKREQLHRLRLENRLPHFDQYLEKSKKLEQKIDEMIDKVDKQTIDVNELKRIRDWAWDEEDQLINEALEKRNDSPAKIEGSLIHRNYWKKKNTIIFSNKLL